MQILSFLSLIAFTLASTEFCVNYCGLKYLILKLADPVQRNEAEIYCKVKGGCLANITSVKQAQFLGSRLETSAIFGSWKGEKICGDEVGILCQNGDIKILPICEKVHSIICDMGEAKEPAPAPAYGYGSSSRSESGSSESGSAYGKSPYAPKKY